MKIKNLLIFLGLLTIVANAQTAKTLKNYSFNIPSGWKQSTNYELSEFGKAANQNIDALIYPDYKKEYNGPPIIFSSFKAATISQSEYEEKATKLLELYKTKMKNFVPKKMETDYKLLKPGQGYYYKSSASFCYMYESKFKSLDLYNVVTGFLTPKGIIMILFTDTKSNYPNTLNGYVQCLSTVKK
jgi:hypothetical protein